jgi:tripartite-type tricarboxylate transporter receptor subunit TctC
MKISGILALAAAGAISAGLSVATPAVAEDFPSKTIKFVVPYNPGGGQDQWARIISSSAIDHFGQALHVQNRPGAGGAVGWKYLMDQPADGHAVYLGSLSPMIAAVTDPNSPMKATDVKIVSFISDFNVHILANAADKYGSWEDLVAAAKAEPGKITIGGTLAQILSAAHIFKQAGVEVNLVPYPGTSKAVADLLGGHIQLAAVTPATTISVGDKGVPLLNIGPRKDGKAFLKGYGKEVPWAGDIGLTGLVQPRWLAVHPDTPEDVVTKLSAAFKATLADKGVGRLISKIGEEVHYTDTAEARKTYLGLIDTIKENESLLK